MKPWKRALKGDAPFQVPGRSLMYRKKWDHAAYRGRHAMMSRRYFYWKKSKKNGGSAWESNPPARVLAPHTGFEVREPHQ